MSNHITGRFEVGVLECKGLKDPNMISKLSSYIELKCGAEVMKTSVQKEKGTSPQFGQWFLFNLDGKEDTLHITIWSKDTLIDDKIGRLDLPLHELAKAQQPTWFDVHSVNNFTKLHGAVLLQSKMEGHKHSMQAQQPVQQQQPIQQQQSVQQQPQVQTIVMQPQVQQVIQPRVVPQVVVMPQVMPQVQTVNQYGQPVNQYGQPMQPMPQVMYQQPMQTMQPMYQQPMQYQQQAVYIPGQPIMYQQPMYPPK